MAFLVVSRLIKYFRVKAVLSSYCSKLSLTIFFYIFLNFFLISTLCFL